MIISPKFLFFPQATDGSLGSPSATRILFFPQATDGSLGSPSATRTSGFSGTRPGTGNSLASKHSKVSSLSGSAKTGGSNASTSSSSSKKLRKKTYRYYLGEFLCLDPEDLHQRALAKGIRPLEDKTSPGKTTFMWRARIRDTGNLFRVSGILGSVYAGSSEDETEETGYDKHKTVEEDGFVVVQCTKTLGPSSS